MHLLRPQTSPPPTVAPGPTEMVLKSPPSALMSLELEFNIAQHKTKATKALCSALDPRWACDPPTTAEPRYSNEPRFESSPWLDSEFVLQVCETIAGQGFPTACHHPLPPLHSGRVPDKKRSSSIVCLEDNKELRVWNRPSSFFRKKPASRFDYWVVASDEGDFDGAKHQMIEPPKNYNWLPARLSSPFFHCSKELDKELPKFRQALCALRNNLKLCVNSTCGLHVHIREQGQNLDLSVIKRVVSLVYLLEGPLLVHLFHPRRSALMISTESRLASAKDCKHFPKNLGSEGAQHLQEIQSLRDRLRGRSGKCDNIISTLHQIWAEPSIASLQNALQAHDNTPSQCGLHISDIHTLEYVYAEASFDADFIYRWAKLVTHISSIANRPAEQFGDTLYRVYEMVTRPEMPSWPAVSAAIGFRVHPDKWQGRIRRYKEELKDVERTEIVPKVSKGERKRINKK